MKNLTAFTLGILTGIALVKYSDKKKKEWITLPPTDINRIDGVK